MGVSTALRSRAAAMGVALTVSVLAPVHAWAAAGAREAAGGRATAGAGTGSATLDRIAATATISLGHRESSVPFSYYDEKHQVVGYSHELALRVAEAVRQALRLPALTIRLVPLTSHNRMPLVVNGTVDLECGSTTHTAEREAQVAFSHSIFIVSTRLLVAADSGIRDFADLSGKTVVVTAGTQAERLLHRYIEQQAAGIHVLAGKDHSDSFRLLASGRAAAFMMDDALLYGERAKARRPADWQVVGTPMSYEAYACMLRAGDPAFKRVVDDALARVMRTGEAARLHERWFRQAIPPRGVNLDWPLSDALAALYREPNDRPAGRP